MEKNNFITKKKLWKKINIIKIIYKIIKFKII